MSPLDAPLSSCLPRLVVATPLNATTIAHCGHLAVQCAVSEVPHSNHTAIIDSLHVDVWMLSSIATANNMAIAAPHSTSCHHPPSWLLHHLSLRHRLSMRWLVVTLPLIALPSSLPRLGFPRPLVVPLPLNTSATLMRHPLVCPRWLSRHLADTTVAHFHSPAVHCTVTKVAHSNRAAIIDSLRVNIWPLSLIATANNMAIVAPHSAIALPSHCPLQ
jgi:hypothetical protein